MSCIYLQIYSKKIQKVCELRHLFVAVGLLRVLGWPSSYDHSIALANVGLVGAAGCCTDVVGPPISVFRILFGLVQPVVEAVLRDDLWRRSIA
jgi:hypothetical protein